MSLSGYAQWLNGSGYQDVRWVLFGLAVLYLLAYPRNKFWRLSKNGKILTAVIYAFVFVGIAYLACWFWTLSLLIALIVAVVKLVKPQPKKHTVIVVRTPASSNNSTSN